MTDGITAARKPELTATHLMVRHPRELPGGGTRRNVEAQCLKDEGNGAGEYVTASGQDVKLSRSVVGGNPALVDADGNVWTVLRL